MASYVERNYLNKHRLPIEQYTLRIYSDTPVNEARVRARIREYYSHEKDNVLYAIKKMMFKQICLAVFGFAVLSLWVLLSEGSNSAGIVKLEILSIIGWVAIWEATSIAIMSRPELVSLKKSYERIINAQIVIEGLPPRDDGDGKDL